MNRHSPLPCTFCDTQPAWSAEHVAADDEARIYRCMECDHDADRVDDGSTDDPDDGQPVRWIGPDPLM